MVLTRVHICSYWQLQTARGETKSRTKMTPDSIRKLSKYYEYFPQEVSVKFMFCATWLASVTFRVSQLLFKYDMITGSMFGPGQVHIRF